MTKLVWVACTLLYIISVPYLSAKKFPIRVACRNQIPSLEWLLALDHRHCQRAGMVNKSQNHDVMSETIRNQALPLGNEALLRISV